MKITTKCPNCEKNFTDKKFIISLIVNVIIPIVAPIITALIIATPKISENTEIVVDCSETMSEQLGDKKRIDILIDAFDNIDLADKDNLALRIFGGECNDEKNTQLIVDFSTGNKLKIKNELKNTKITGKKRTLVDGIINAISDFNDATRFDKSVNKRVVIITSGKDDECRKNTSLYHKRARRNDVEIVFPIIDKIQLIGIGVKESDKKELKKLVNDTYFVNNEKEIENVFKNEISKSKERFDYYLIFLSIGIILLVVFTIYFITHLINNQFFSSTKDYFFKEKKILISKTKNALISSETIFQSIFQGIASIIFFAIAIALLVFFIFAVKACINDVLLKVEIDKQKQLPPNEQILQKKPKIFKQSITEQRQLLNLFSHVNISNAKINNNKGTIYTIGDITNCLNEKICFSKYIFFLDNYGDEWKKFTKKLNTLSSYNRKNYKYYILLEGCADRAQVPNNRNFYTIPNLNYKNFYENFSDDLKKDFNNNYNSIYYFKKEKISDWLYLKSVLKPKLLSKNPIDEGYCNFDLPFFRAIFIKNILISNKVSMPIALIEGAISNEENHEDRTVILHIFETEQDLQSNDFIFEDYFTKK